MLQVTVPCEKCSAPVGFGSRKCPVCGASVSKDAKRALHARLAASSEDYRDLQNQISSARTALLVASLMYLVVGAIAFLGSAQPDETTPPIVGAAFIIDAVVATVFLLLWWFARTRPAFAMLLAAVLWLALQLLLSVTLPVLAWSGLWFKGVVAILMIRGIIAALSANVFLRKLRKPPNSRPEADRKENWPLL
jgi:peptidoglycan/LPS O-acetylase OafA/YrhL